MKRSAEHQSSGDDHLQDIIRYYEETQFDYRVAWTGKSDLAVHFGFYRGDAHRHQDALVNTNRMLADLVDIQPGESVLDAGCGKGGSCFWLARERGAHVTGINPVASQIAECRRHAAVLSLTEATDFHRADFTRTPFESGRFHVLWACESLCHARDKSAFYREAYRLLRPGGRLVIAEYIRRRRPLTAPEEKLLAAWLHRWAIPDIDTAAEHRDAAAAAGFSDFQLRDYTRYTWASLKNLHKISRRWIGIGHLLRLLGLRSAIQHGNHVGSIRQFEALRQDCWFYGVLTARKPDQCAPAR